MDWVPVLMLALAGIVMTAGGVATRAWAQAIAGLLIAAAAVPARMAGRRLAADPDFRFWAPEVGLPSGMAAALVMAAAVLLSTTKTKGKPRAH